MEEPVKKSLSARPHLDHLRSQAKQLLSALRDGDASAARTFIEYLPAAKKMTVAQVRSANLRLADAQSAIARKSGFAGWPGLAKHVEQLRALEGEWHFVSLRVDGSDVPAPPASSAKLSIDGDRFRMDSSDGAFDGVFTIDVEATPPRIDIEFVEGPEAGNWSYGIFELDGDTLILCVAVVGEKRPMRFASDAGSGHALERLKRASAARPANVNGGKRRTTTPKTAPEPVDETPFAPHMTPLLERLQGDWIPTSLVNDGKPLADTLLRYGSRTMTGNETKVVFGGQVMVHARIRIDETQMPHAVDYLNIGRGARTLTRGIMEVADGTVRFCMAPAGAPRPGEFASPAGSGHVLSEWRRSRVDPGESRVDPGESRSFSR
jgi:uncharacterized protein (TIGR03067 family)